MRKRISMKNIWQAKKLGEFSFFIIVTIFAPLFFISGQYVLSFATLCLLVIAVRIKDLKTFAVSPKDGLKVDFKEVEEAKEKISEIINSSKPNKEKIEESQELVNKVFELGYVAGSGKPFKVASNVIIKYDENGKIVGCQYTYT